MLDTLTMNILNVISNKLNRLQAFEVCNLLIVTLLSTYVVVCRCNHLEVQLLTQDIVSISSLSSQWASKFPPNKKILEVWGGAPIPILKIPLDCCGVFTKMAVGQGYHQFTLDLETRKVATVSTPWENYRLRRLVFGAKSFQDVFDEVMFRVFWDTFIASIKEMISSLGKRQRRTQRGLKNCSSASVRLWHHLQQEM